MANRTDPEAKTIHGTNPQVSLQQQYIGHIDGKTRVLSRVPVLSTEHGGEDSADENL